MVAGFDGGKITSQAGAMLLGATDRAIGLIARFAGCFTDHRAAALIEHRVPTLAQLTTRPRFALPAGVG